MTNGQARKMPRYNVRIVLPVGRHLGIPAGTTEEERAIELERLDALRGGVARYIDKALERRGYGASFTVSHRADSGVVIEASHLTSRGDLGALTAAANITELLAQTLDGALSKAPIENREALAASIPFCTVKVNTR